jgi:menaquinone-specific isochorismate synthase
MSSWPLDLNHYPKFYWQSRGSGALSGAGTLPIAPTSRLFGWRHFSPTPAEEWRDFPSSYFFCPRFEMWREELSPNELKVARSIRIKSCESTPTREEWIRGVEMALKEIHLKRFEKVVLARRVTIVAEHPIDPMLLSQALAMKSANRTVFFFQPTPDSAFLGASPEILFRRQGREIECDALAGTRPVNLADELFKSEKEGREFSIVQEHLLHALGPLCLNVPKSTPLAIRSTPSVSHLHSLVSGRLKDNVSDDDLLKSLHPNGAICGHPCKEALSFSNSFEPFARGLYAGSIGWKEPGSAEFAIGIRSCLVQGNHAYLYAGTGIVEGSDPAAEWEESEQKLSHWMSFFHE